MSRRRLALLTLLAAALLAIVMTPALTTLLTDWWWFEEIGYGVVFRREWMTRILVFLIAGAVGSVVLYLNLRLAQRGLVPDPMVVRIGGSRARLDLTEVLRRVSLPAALILGALSGLAVAGAWEVILRARYGTPFGVADPIFGRDIGYYVFTMPGLSLALGFVWWLAGLSLVLSLLLYRFRGDLVFRPKRVQLEPSAGMHLGALLAVLFLLTALRLWLVNTPSLLYSSTGPLVGASYTDLHATLPALRLSAVVAAIAAVAMLVGGLRRKLVLYAAVAVATYLVIGVLGRGALPAVVQKLVVAPTELTRERPYLEHHIRATRRAWGLDSVELRDLSSEATLTLADIRANPATIENVRLWDREPLLQTFGQLQEIRTYYDFVSVDDDRYWIDGKYRQVLLSPRELNPAALPTRTFINEHLTFTHGMGLTLSPVNQVTAEGLPVLFVQDLPPRTTGSLAVTRPQIYYGELAGEYVIVGTRQREFDHPSGEENVYTAYQGSGGVPLGGMLRRALFALRFGSSNILFSGEVTPASRILYYRTILARARRALPFLEFDRDPYMVLREDGTLVWLLDAYTTTDRFPYSQRLADGTSYMRNSVKLAIDAYDGSLTAYVSDAGDPLLRTWDRVYPGILVPLDNMPADLRAHVRYPDDIYRHQTALYTTYHMESPEDFYHREDQWQIPVVAQPDGSVPFMRHLVMRLPGEEQAEFIYMVPFTPRGKQNLAAWMVARSDGDAYGQLRVYRLSRQSLVFGPRQIENRINQDTEISRQVSLWDQRGSRVIRGNLLVIPIEESLLYVQPLYLQADGGQIPELKRVVVAYQNRVVMHETLDLALTALFGGGSGEVATPRVLIAAEESEGSGQEALRALAAEARRSYQQALDAQRAGDWTRYGEEIRRLGELLARLAGGAAP